MSGSAGIRVYNISRGRQEYGQQTTPTTTTTTKRVSANLMLSEGNLLKRESQTEEKENEIYSSRIDLKN